MPITKYLWLPKELTPFERDYASRMNRVSLAFFWANLPVFVAVAFFNQTGPLFAAALTSLVLAGPTIAWLTLKNPRHTSLVVGFTAMCMGGLLAHFGQGPLQIEMHFYFFSLLAALAVFGNPAVILVAAITVTLHHTVIYLLIPSSVFNYDASIWVVAVHASFVVVESAAALFISRSFFDNVIGLDKIVRERTAELDARNEAMRLVLDHVDQGLLTLDREGRPATERSAITDRWLGEPQEEQTFFGMVERLDANAAAWMELGWEEVVDGFLPVELSLGQLPSRIDAGDRQLDLQYIPIVAEDADEDARPEQVLVVISDVTAQVAAALAEEEQKETLRVFEHFLSDKAGFLEFFAEADRLVQDISNSTQDNLILCKRLLHTLKGNAMIYGLESFGAHVHDLESAIIERGESPSAEEKRSLTERWGRLRDNLDTLLGERADQGIELDADTYATLVEAVESGRAHEHLLRMIKAWRLEPTSTRLDRLASQALGIAERLGKGHVKVEMEDHGLRLDPERFRSFWGALVHVIRNAIDHGIEDRDARIAAGKPGEATLGLRTWLDAGFLNVEIRDDGRGIDWDRVREKALRQGHRVDSPEELQEALFADGISTRDEASAYSGRGVGMSAVREACEALGGTIQVQSTPGRGTAVRFVFRAREEVISMAA